jgi:hypothetical protein
MSPKGGHNRKSDAEKKLSGTFRKDRGEGTKRLPRDPLERLANAKGYTAAQVRKLYAALPPPETAPAPVEPVGPAPRSLPLEARTVWEKLRGELDVKGSYRGRRLLLENYCRSQARLEDPKLERARYNSLLGQVRKMLDALLDLDVPPRPVSAAVSGQPSGAAESDATPGTKHPKYPDLLVGDIEPHRWSQVSLTTEPVRRRREFIAHLREKYGNAVADAEAKKPNSGVWLGAQPQPPDAEGQRAVRYSGMTRVRNGSNPSDPSAPDTFEDSDGRIHTGH